MKFIYSVFDEKEINRLRQDLERRFRKPLPNGHGWFWKFVYINQNIQYKTLIYYRLYNACKVRILKSLFALLYQKSSLKSGVEFAVPVIGGGVIMPHWGRITVNANSIGENLYIFHNVTIGNDYTSGRPEIGNNVFIGTNSVVLGDIKIGDNVVIGACSFVKTDIPSNCMVAGNPAKVIKSIEDDFITRMIGY